MNDLMNAFKTFSFIFAAIFMVMNQVGASGTHIAWGVAVTSAVVGLIAKIVWDWLSNGRHGKDKGHGAAGSRPVEFWEQKFNSVLESQRDIVAKTLQGQREIMDQIREMRNVKDRMHEENLRALGAL